jgi:transcriptional regulator with XRE-family HTH domain
MEQRELASTLGVSVTTLSRMENGKTPIADSDLVRVADACTVPVSFVDVGFAPLDRPITDVERRLHELEATVRRISAGGLPAPEGELGRRLEEHETSERDPVQPGSQPVTDAQPNNG